MYLYEFHSTPPHGDCHEGGTFTMAFSTPPPSSVPTVNFTSTSDSLANSLDSEKQSTSACYTNYHCIYLSLLQACSPASGWKEKYLTPFFPEHRLKEWRRVMGKPKSAINVVKYHRPSYIWNRWAFLWPGLLNRRVLLGHMTTRQALFLPSVLLTSKACIKLPPVYCCAVSEGFAEYYNHLQSAHPN